MKPPTAQAASSIHDDSRKLITSEYRIDLHQPATKVERVLLDLPFIRHLRDQQRQAIKELAAQMGVRLDHGESTFEIAIRTTVLGETQGV